MTAGRCVALTGGIACGKSTVAGFWRQRGAETLDADEVAHGLLAPGGECVGAVAGAFGPEVLAPDGGVDRDRLGRIVFADPDARRRLEALVHPAVVRRMREWAADADRVIENNGSLAELESACRAAWTDMTEQGD